MNAPTGAAPLREGTVLDERFAVGPMLGRGGFGITYLVEDLARGDRAIVNELAPIGSVRVGDDIEFRAIGPAAGQRLRHQFTYDARRLQRFRVPRVPQYRAVFHEHGTAYFATDFIEHARPLTELVGGPPLDYDATRRIFDLLLETLEGAHNHGVIHQDIRPSNILLGRSGEPYLVDFGSARQWHADLTIAHDVQFVPEFASPEQLSEKGRRTPATDLYGLAATTYTLLAGSPPTPAARRLAGEPLISLRPVRPDVPPEFATAIEQALSLDPAERPSTAAELRFLLHRPTTTEEESDRLKELDAKRRRLQRFRHDPMQCPACGDVLTVPEPLAPGVCPVCQDGRIKQRRIEPRACPSCGGGILRKVQNSAPLLFCPRCATGRMLPKKRLLRETKAWECEACGYALIKTGIGAKDIEDNDLPWEERRVRSGRSQEVMFCDACLAQYDVMPDGRWQRMTPDLLGHEWTRLHPDEWARVAAGLPPDAGNAFCESCSADFFIADGCLTLLSDPAHDPHGFATYYCGHLIPVSEVLFLAVGKESGKKGPVCRGCRIEFDSHGTELKLVRSADARLRKHVGETYRLKDWHRIAQDLPQTGHEDEITEDIEEALSEAYCEGEVPFEAKNSDLVWRGRASEVYDGSIQGRPRRFTVTTDSVTFGSTFRKRVELTRDVLQCHAQGDVLTMQLIDGEAWSLRIDEVELRFRLESGRADARLTAEHLARRLSAVAKRGRGKP